MSHAWHGALLRSGASVAQSVPGWADGPLSHHGYHGNFLGGASLLRSTLLMHSLVPSCAARPPLRVRTRAVLVVLVQAVGLAAHLDYRHPRIIQ